MIDLLDLVYLGLYLFIWTALSTGGFSLAALALRSHALGFAGLADLEREQLRADSLRAARERKRREAEEMSKYRA